MTTRSTLLLAPLLVLAVVGCDDDDDGDTGTGPHDHDPATVELRIAHNVGGADLVFNEMNYTTAEGNPFAIQNLEYILSRITMVSTTARSAEVMRAHYVDGFEAGTHTLTLDELPEGTYTALSFTYGLDEEMNLDPDQGGDLPTTTEWTSMRWPETWGGGYHYMKLEGNFMPDGGTTPATLATHTGRRYAQGDGTFPDDDDPIPHFVEFMLPFPSPLVVEDGDAVTVELEVDLAEWYTDPNDFDLDQYPMMIMMNTAAQNLLEDNATSVFSLGEVTSEHED